jgi:hypothetical protein
MVGCHRGAVEGCRFRQERPGPCHGVQVKGGASEIVIRGCRFEEAGDRAVNVGGRTGPPYFRPPLPTALVPGTRLFEARAIVVEGNTFVGGGAPVAFINVEDAVFRRNTVYRPRRFAARLLQENRDAGFAAAADLRYERNVVAFRAGEWVEAVNVGPDTDPSQLKIAANYWFCLDAPAASKPRLPVVEAAGVYGPDPGFRDPEGGDLRLTPGSPAAGYGADGTPAAR